MAPHHIVTVGGGLLLESDDWDAAGHADAEAHDRDYAVTHETEDWFGRIFGD